MTKSHAIPDRGEPFGWDRIIKGGNYGEISSKIGKGPVEIIARTKTFDSAEDLWRAQAQTVEYLQ